MAHAKNHDYHILPPSIWPLLGAVSAFAMLFGVVALLVDISQVFTLEVGDVVMTGTPAGVAALASGDQLKMTLHTVLGSVTWQTFVA